MSSRSSRIRCRPTDLDVEACRRRAARPRSAGPACRPGAATARRGRRPRSPRGCATDAEQPVAPGRTRAAGGAPAPGSGPRRRAAARSRPGTAPCSAGTSAACRPRLQPSPAAACGVPRVRDPGRRRAPRLGAMIRRIDLRGAAAGHAVDYRAVVPRADFDVEAARPGGASDLRRRPGPRGRGDPGVLRAVRRGRARRHPGAAAALAAALAALDPDVRAGLEESSRRLRATCEAELEQDVTTDLAPGATRHPADGAGRPGRALRPRRPGAAGLQRGDERRARPGRRRRLDRAGQPAAAGPRRAAAPDDPGRLRAARRRRGVRRRRSPGDRDVRLRRRARAARSTWSPARATSTPSPPSGCSRASSASTPRPDRPRSRSSPTTPPTRRTSPPT